jgi:tripartite-type tricarboxylate transporter receptor subunit TctC
MRAGRRVLHFALAMTLPSLVAALDAVAQAYPSRPLRVVVGTSAGGGGDVIARVVGSGMTSLLGQQVTIDNRPGAASNIAAEIVARAPADGHTLFLVSITHAVNVSLYRNLTFDLTRDFAAVTQLASSPQVIVVHPSLPVKTVAELVKLAKARPGTLNYSSAGAGTSTFLAAELFKSRAGIDLAHVAYRGGGAALTAAVAGESPVYFAPVASALPLIRAGRLRALAVTSTQRLALLPELPTAAEGGYPGYQCGNWYGFMLPAKTPKEVVAALHRATLQALVNPEIARRLGDLGYVVIGDQPDEFMAFIRSEIEALAKVVKTLNLKAEAQD